MDSKERKYQILDAWKQPTITSIHEKLQEIVSLFKRSGSETYAKSSFVVNIDLPPSS